MAEHDTERRGPRSVLLIGAGRHAHEVGAVLAALSSLDSEGERRLEPLVQLGVADLEELLAQRPVEGLLILESGRVPGEDIGFVRRFLERHAGWRLLVVGEVRQESRALLALARAHWLAWPPNLEELAGLLQPPRATPAAAPATREERAAPRRGARRTGTPGPGSNGGVDVGALIEELLAGAALQGESVPRFQFRPGEPCLVHVERVALLEGLGGLVELARQCAAPDGLVRASLEPGAGGVRLVLDFPLGPLPETDLSTLLEGDGAGLETEMAEGLRAAHEGAALLRELGGQVELAALGEGRARCEVRLSLQPPVPQRSARAGKPEDPFA